MGKKLTTSHEGLQLIKRYEGLSLKAYLCPAGVWTIGYGHTGGVPPGRVITEQQAEDILKDDLQHAEDEVDELVSVPLTQQQFDALVSFTYNLGGANLANSTLLRKLNNKDYEGAANQFSRWIRAGGRTLEGLVRRRAEERELFLHP